MIEPKDYTNPYGIWEVTTESDCSGMTTDHLGVFEGYVDDIALAKEEKDSLGAQTYPNIIAVKEGSESRPELQKLVDTLRSDEIKDFIAEKYQGAVEPIE